MIQSNEPMSPSCEAEMGLADLLEIVSRQLAAGEEVDFRALCCEHPQYADELTKLLPTIQQMACLANKSHGHTLPSDALGSAAPDGDSPVLGTLGDYEILGEVGRGGMGVVYRARQKMLGREVAVKVLPMAALADRHQLARFRNEVRATATLHHPHIVPIHTVGEERGIHYYAMQYIDGPTLAQIIRRLKTEDGGREPGVGDGETEPLHANHDTRPDLQDSVATERSKSTAAYCRTVARWGMQAAQALAHAHENGVIHRDIKPGNLFLDESRSIWVADFGLARLESGPAMTDTGDIVGTLRYMAPEQALGKPAVVDHRTDIYSLGATLYELLTLEPVHRGENRQELLHQIASLEPRAPRKIDPGIPNELETLVLHAMDKDPADRYQTVQELADDLQRFLDHRPIVAKRSSVTDRLRKWSRRHVGLVWTLLLASLAVAVALGISAALIAASRNLANQQRKQAEQERSTAIQERNAARLNRYYAEIVAGQTSLENNNQGGLYSQLINYLPTSREMDLRDWEWFYLMSQCRPEVRTIIYPGAFTFAAWSPDGRYIGTPGAIWQAQTGEQVRRFNTARIRRWGVAWSPDGSKFAWGMASDDHAIYIWDRTSDSVSRLAGHDGSVWRVAWSPDGSRIASASTDNTIRIWVVASATVQWTIPISYLVRGLEWSPDGQLLAAATDPGGIRVWDVSERELLHERTSPGKYIGLSWHPDRNWLAVRETGRWILLEPDDWSTTCEVELSGGGPIAFSPDGSQIAVSEGESLSIWDSRGDNRLASLNGHRSRIESISWSPHGRQLVTADEVNSAIKLWDLDRPERPPSINTGAKVESIIESIAWLDENNTLLTIAGEAGAATMWNAWDGSLKRRDTPLVKPPYRLSPDGKLAAVHDEKGQTISILDASSGATSAMLRLDPGRSLHSYTFSVDGSRMVTQTAADKTLVLDFWDVDTERLCSSWKSVRMSEFDSLEILAWSDGGDHLTAMGWGDLGENGSHFWRQHLYVFDVSRGERVLKRVPAGGGGIATAAWSRDGRFLAVGTTRGFVEVIELETGRQLFSEKICRTPVSALAWHPGGKRLACATIVGRQIKLVTSKNGRALLSFSVPKGGWTSRLAWSSDGKCLAAATSEGRIHIWDAGRGYEISADGPRRGELAWAYHDRAKRASGEIKGDALREFMRHAPDALGFWEARGSVLATLGEFDRAFEEFSKGIEPDVTYAFQSARHRSLCLLGAGHVDRYRMACAQLVDDFKDSPVPSNRTHVAWLCTLTPNQLVDSKQVLQMARDAYEEGDNHDQLVTGASLYRDGQHDEAVRNLTELAAKLDRGGDYTDRYRLACARYFLSLARFDMGHAFQARRLLDEANRMVHLRPQGASYPNRVRSVVLDTLRREATLLIGRGPVDAGPAKTTSRANQ